MSLDFVTEGPHTDVVILAIDSNAEWPFCTARWIWSFHEREESNHTPKIRRESTLSALCPRMVTVDRRSSVTLLFFVKWITWYLSGANIAPNLLAHATHLS